MINKFSKSTAEVSIPVHVYPMLLACHASYAYNHMRICLQKNLNLKLHDSFPHPQYLENHSHIIVYHNYELHK